MNDQVEAAGRVAMRTGRVFGGLICLAFILAGLIFAWLVGQQAWMDLETHFWKRTPCKILQSDPGTPLTHGGGPYTVSIRYEYQWQNHTYHSDQVFRERRSFSDYQHAQRLLERYRPQGKARCRVNPHHPEQAILEVSAPWIALFLIIPIFFLVVGVAGFYAAIFGHPDVSTPRVDPTGETSQRPIFSPSRESASRLGVGLLLVFFFIFFCIGTGFFYVMMVRPMQQSWAAQSWNEVPCRIVSSHLREQSTDNGPTYRVDILFEYQVNGRTLRSNRHHFFTMSTGGQKSRQQILDRYSVGQQTVCYVNPADPTDAVLDRQLPNEKWIGLFPLIFVVIGAGGMIHVWRRSKQGLSTTRLSAPRPDLAGGAAPMEDIRPIVLRSTKGRLGKVIGTFLFAAVWNGIISVFVVDFIHQTQRGHAEWLLGLFLTPFVVVGIFFIGLFGYFVLGLFAPRAVVSLSTAHIRLGEFADLNWQFAGRAHVIEKLRIYLEGREEATYRRGTSTSTDHHVFAEIEIASPMTVDEVRAGQGRVLVPAETVPTFAADNNRIVWTLRFKGVIRLYPDIDDVFPITVLPRARGNERAVS